MTNSRFAKSLSSLYLAVLFVGLVLPIIGFCVIGSYSRYAADDYQFSSDIRDLGFVKYQVHWYQNWTGRFAYIFTNSLIYPIGPIIVPLLPVFGLILLSFGWFWVFRMVGYLFRWDKVQWIALTISFTLILATFASLENIRQVLYWPTGLMNYMSPMILLPFVLGSLLTYMKYKFAGHKPPGIIYIMIPVLAFLAGAYSEAFSVVQILLYLSLIFICWFFVDPPFNKDMVKILGLALIAAVISTLIVFIAPGNAIRQAIFPPPPALPELLKMSFQFAFIFLKQQFRRNLIILGLALFFPWLVSMATDDSNINTNQLVIPKAKIIACLIAIPLIGLLLIATSFAASAWGTSAYPAPRTVSITHYILSITLVIWGVVAGWGMRAELKSKEITSFVFFLICTTILVLGPMRIALDQYKVELPTAQKFARQWDRRDAILRLAAQEKVEAIGVRETINYYDLEQLQPYLPMYQWINAEMSRYYKIKNIYLDTSKK